MTIHPPACDEQDARIVSRSGLLPPDASRSRAKQARDLFECMENELRKEGLTFAHVVRTWFHLDAILDWYREFNAVRNTFFRERHVFDGVVPASTGVGLANPHGVALVGGFLAVQPRSERVRVVAVSSPLQCPALDYNSDFSRAVEVQVPGRRHLYISGTASIEATGASVYCDDIDGQIRWTLQVVTALLASRNMTWNAHASRATAYFPDLRNAPRLAGICQSQGLAELQVPAMQAVICRQDLLFELELDAIART